MNCLYFLRILVLVSNLCVLWSRCVVIIVNHERKIVVTLRLVPFIKHSFNPIHYSYVSWWKHVLSISLHCIKNEVKLTYLKKKKSQKKDEVTVRRLTGKCFCCPLVVEKVYYLFSLFTDCPVKIRKQFVNTSCPFSEMKPYKNVFMSCFKVEIMCLWITYYLTSQKWR